MPVHTQRNSCDSTVRPNRWGTELLDLCCATGMRIANGRAPGDEEGQVTFVSQSQEGSSLIDYVLASPDALQLIQSLRVLPAPESDHSALHLLFQRAAPQDPPQRQKPRSRPAPQEPAPPEPPRLKGAALLTAWQQLLEQPHVASDLFLIGTSAGAATCADDIHAIGNDLDRLIERTQAEVLASRPTAKGRRRGAKEQPSWWDGELAIGRRAARQTARRDPRSHAARQARAEYQRLLRRKQSRYTRSRAIALVNLARDNPARFWSRFKPAKKRPCPLPDAVMVEYFRDLLGQPPSHSASQDNPADIGTATPPAADGSELNEAFTAASVAQGIKSLRGGKATVGSLKLDALSVAVASLAPCLAQVFDACKRVGALPRSWALCGITPIHKGGDTNDPGNYRGIAVGSLLAKLYASMLNAMLMGWTERWDLRARGQAGFRKDHRTTDQTFVLRTLIESARARKVPLFTCFVDFKKAYDTIPRDKLWEKLRRIGVSDEFVQAVQALYAEVPMGVQLPSGLSDTFMSELGVKQGCPLSPTLFGIFIDDFQTELEARAAGFSLPNLVGEPTPALFYADDLALASTSVQGLQAQLDLLEAYSDHWGLTVNVKKTKVVAYSTARRAVAAPMLTYKSAPIDVLDKFTYLGVELHSTQGFAQAGAARAAAARRAALALQNRCADLCLHDPTLMLHIFDALVRPVMLYGVEAWGPGALCFDPELAGCEVVQRKFLRCLLGVRDGTPNASALGELAAFPLAHTAATLLCRFWNRLVDMPEDRLTKQAFLENVALTACGTDNVRSACWAAQVDSFLPFMQPIVDGVPQYMDPDAMSAVLQRRYFDSVNDSDKRKVQDWLQIRGPLNFDSYSLPSHMQDIPSRTSRVRLAQFRTGSHW